jgi:hypothetical protein
MKKLLTLLLSVLMPQLVFCWGGRGHDTVCQAAVYLVKNKNLSDFLKFRPHVMGHLCNLPDTFWRSLDRKLTQHGDPTHYVNAELIGVAIQDMPTDLNAIIEKYSNDPAHAKKKISVPMEMGTNWWRADQMVRRGIEFGKQIASAEAPTNSKQAQDEQLLYNKSVFEMFVSMGILGHFVADNAQPFHNTSDYDGYAANQGGIHSFYEEQSVAFLPPSLINDVVRKAGKLKNTKFMKGKTNIEKMKSLSGIAALEIKSVLKADPIIKNSQLKIEKGMSLKTPAERQPPEIGAKRFEKLIVEEMARAAKLLAWFWDDIYEQSGSPNLKPYRSYRYPHTIDFVMPDYYDTKADSAE